MLYTAFLVNRESSRATYIANGEHKSPVALVEALIQMRYVTQSCKLIVVGSRPQVTFDNTGVPQTLTLSVDTFTISEDPPPVPPQLVITSP